MGKPKAPKPPDPRETSAASTGTSVATALANTNLGNVNQIGPDGSLRYSQTGRYSFTDPYTKQTYRIPTFTARTELSPHNQRIYNNNKAAELGMSQVANKAGQNLNNVLGQNFSPSNLPGRGSVPNAPQLQNMQGANLPRMQESYGTDFSADRQRVEQALLDRMNPEIERDREAMRTQMANSGIGLGSDAYSAAQSDFGRNVNDARLGAILAGGQEQSRLVGMEAQRAAFGNAARQQAFQNLAGMTQQNNANRMQQFGAQSQSASQRDAQRAQTLQEQFALRNQPINEITALLSGSQVAMPNFQMNQPSRIPTTDNAGLINERYNQEMGNYQQRMNQWNSTIGGLFGLGAAFL